MDTIRRWQLATAVTAVTGLGLGAMAVGHQPSEEVPPIDLTPSPASSSPRPVDDEPVGGDGAEIVPPEVRSLDASVASLATPEPTDAPTTDTTDTTDTTGTPGTTGTPVPSPAPAEPADSPDSPDSLDSD